MRGQKPWDGLIGKETTVLIESVSGATSFGKTDHFASVQIEGALDGQIGKPVQVTLVSHNGSDLRGVLV